MNEFKQYVVGSKLQEITELIWPTFNKMGSNTTESFDIQKFGLSIGDNPINELKVTKINEDDRPANYRGLNKIFAGNRISLPHEISHFIYRCNHKPEERNSDPLTTHIISVCKNANIAQNINDFYKRDSISNYDKLIAYLYLADENELTAKLAGLYVGSKLDTDKIKDDDDDYYKGLNEIYNDITKFNIDENEIDTIVQIDTNKKSIYDHLREKTVSANVIQDLIKEMKVLAKKYLDIYENILEN